MKHSIKIKITVILSIVMALGAIIVGMLGLLDVVPLGGIATSLFMMGLSIPASVGGVGAIYILHEKRIYE